MSFAKNLQKKLLNDRPEILLSGCAVLLVVRMEWFGGSLGQTGTFIMDALLMNRVVIKYQITMVWLWLTTRIHPSPQLSGSA